MAKISVSRIFFTEVSYLLCDLEEKM